MEPFKAMEVETENWFNYVLRIISATDVEDCVSSLSILNK